MADERPIIVVKKVKKVEGGHHGGAWKVAYADFVTAMMAFFLLLWLLNVTTDEQKFGIAQYFDPVSVSKSVSGSGGVLGGKSMIKDGAMISPSQPMGLDMQMPGIPESGPNSEESGFTDQYGDGERAIEDPSNLKIENDPSSASLNKVDPKSLTKEQLEKLIAAKEQSEFDQAAEQIRQAIQENPDLAELAPHLIIDHTPEGLRIQVIDQEGRSMFPVGSARMYEETKGLFTLVTGVINKLPNLISITGHTDSTPYRAGASYDNWNLSADRANSSRKALIAAGLDPKRINHVTGKADTEHLIPDDPTSPRNRRVSIVLLKQNDYPVQDPAVAAGLKTDPNAQAPTNTQPVDDGRPRPVEALDYNQRQQQQPQE